MKQFSVKEPDPRTLSREFLIKSSSLVAVEHVMMVFTQTTLGLEKAEKEYKNVSEDVLYWHWKAKWQGSASDAHVKEMNGNNGCLDSWLFMRIMN